MLGAIAGDVIGSVYEFHPLQGNWADFPLFSEGSRFTDDTVLTMAVADALLKAYGQADLRNCLVNSMHSFCRLWPRAGYGGRFAQWLKSRSFEPYNSFGNGSAMRVSPVGWAAESLEEAEKLAEATADVTHNHPEGIKGAQAVAGSIFLARKGASKDDIKSYVSERHNYDLSRSLEEIRKNYGFDETCQGSVPEAISAFLESENFEEAIRKAVWLRGDADTQAAIAGGIAEAFYGGVPRDIADRTLLLLDQKLIDTYSAWQDWRKEA